MAVRHNTLWALAIKMALVALALSACAAPTAVPPTATPTELPTATPLPPTTTPQSTPTSETNAGVPATSIQIASPWGLAFDPDGNLYVTQCFGINLWQPYMYKIDSFGLLRVFALDGGMNSLGFSGDGGPARAALMDCPGGVAADRDGNLYVADVGNNRIRRIDRNGIINTVADSGPAGVAGDVQGMAMAGSFGGDGGPATSARLWGPVAVAFDPAGDLYIADSNNNRVRKVDRQGIITTVVGTGVDGFSGDGSQATAAQVSQTGDGWLWIATDAEGNLYLADNNRIRKVDQQGIITTIAGTGEEGFSGDGGLATAAKFSGICGMAFDAQGNLYLSDIGNQRVRKIETHGVITTVAGTGVQDFSGDGGLATAATLNGPGALAFDREGNLYINDYGNNRVRKVDKNGIITTAAGHF